MGLFRGNLIWIAATAVVGFGAGAALVLLKPAPFFVAEEAPEAAASEDVSENARVLAALQALENARDTQEVTREAPVDLLQVAPKVQPEPEAPREVETVDTAASAAFFNAAQDDLAAHDTCGDDLRALAAGTRVYFPSGGLSAANAGLASARLIGQVARDCPGYTVQVEGHSDRTGDPAVNQRLSESRAETVVSRLAAGGIDTSNFVFVGYGDTRPSGVTGPEDSTYYDRRVEFSIIENTQTASLGTQVQPWQQGTAQVASCVQALQAQAAQSRIFFAARAITVTPGEMETAQDLARQTMACDGARLRLVGHFSDQPGSRESTATARLRALALMSSLVSSGAKAERILVGAPSHSIGIQGQPGLPNSRIDFQIITD